MSAINPKPERKTVQTKTVPADYQPTVSANGKPVRMPSASGHYHLYRVKLNHAAMPKIEFDAIEGTEHDDLREQAASAFMDWFDTVDWTIETVPLFDYEQVPEKAVGQAADAKKPKANSKRKAVKS